MEGGAVTDLAGQEPDERQLAAMGGVEGLEDLRDGAAASLEA